MDALACLRLQIEWGADEALADDPVDRRVSRTEAPALPGLPTAPVAPPAPVPLAAPPSSAVARATALAASAQTVAELEAALAGFDGCALRATATKLVFGSGDPASRLVLVEGLPCAPEDRAGTPFAGTPGLFLDRMLASIGLDRSQLRTVSLVPWRPPGDRKPTEAEVAMCLPFLHRHLSLIAPDRIVLFGALAARTLLPASPRRARPGWAPMPVPGLREPVPTLALGTTLHIQATPAAKRDAWTAMLLLRRALNP